MARALPVTALSSDFAPTDEPTALTKIFHQPCADVLGGESFEQTVATVFIKTVCRKQMMWPALEWMRISHPFLSEAFLALVVQELSSQKKLPVENPPSVAGL